MMSCPHLEKNYTRLSPHFKLVLNADDDSDDKRTMTSTDVPSSSDDASLSRRSWYDILTPFSPSALARLPNSRRPQRYTRADAIPETENQDNGQRPTVRDYHAINSLPPQVRVPKKIPTSIKVEGKVWFANERSMFSVYNPDNSYLSLTAWVSWLNISILLGTLALALFNASKDQIATNFAIFYAVVSIAVLVRLLFYYITFF
jgi:hypothetical protein